MLFSCVKTIQEQNVVQGYLIDEKTGNPFNPYNRATVRLVSTNNNSNFNSTTLGSSTVQSDGSYNIICNKINSSNEIWLYLLVDDNSNYNIYKKIELQSPATFNFIIPCPVLLNIKFINLSGTVVDSLIANVLNSKGNKRYKNQITYQLNGDESNYIELLFYANNTVYLQKNDTVFSGCRTTVNDTINY